MKISAINNYQVNIPNFEGKKSNNIQSSAHTSTPLKAVPVALLIAMSPVDMPKATAQISPVKLEQIQKTQDELVDEQICQNATPDNMPGRIKMYMSRDGEEYIKIDLAKDVDAFAMNDNGDFVDAVKTINVEIRPEEFLIENISYSGRGKSAKERKYYVIGSGIRYVSQVKDAQTGDKIKRSYDKDTLKIESQKFEITEDFYNLINQNSYNTSTTEENRLIFVSGNTMKGF